MNKEAIHWNNHFLKFLKNSVTPFHVVQEAKQILEQAGFEELLEQEEWELAPKKKYFVIREGSLITWVQPEKPAQGIKMVGTHSDSPCLKLRPNASSVFHNYLRLGCEVYGGVILSTWFDRSLGIAGKIVSTKKDKLSETLVQTSKAVALLPNLAIHLNRDVNENRSIQKQMELVPIWGQANQKPTHFIADVFPEFKNQDILSFDLSLFDTHSPDIVGNQGEFIASARLDNLLSTYAGVAAIAESKSKSASLLVISDHEEVGSASNSGAAGSFLKTTLARILPNVQERAICFSRSLLISADNAHGIHPNYPERHDGLHAPVINAGPAVKVNYSQRYATNASTHAAVQLLARAEKIPLQIFVSRNDIPCGSTIGPITATSLGIPTVDIGAPTFAMHSIRETSGTLDPWYLFRLFRRFFE